MRFDNANVDFVSNYETKTIKTAIGVTHQSITIGFELRHIRVSHLVLGLHTLDYHTCYRARTHWSLTPLITFFKSTVTL